MPENVAARFQEQNVAKNPNSFGTTIMANQKPFVSILCATYNQKDYIAQTIEGFLMQKVDFPIEIIIHDDASTDGTTDIVRKYANEHPDIIKPIFQTENQYSKHVGIWKSFIYPKAQGEYHSECEGDDYWTDPNKLQRQVDFLKSHPEYVLSTENAQVLFTNTGIVQPFSTEPAHDVSLEDLLIRRRFPTASAVYRSKFISEFLNQNIPSFDTCFWAFLATKGKIHFNPIVSSIYRRGTGVTEANKVKWAFTSERINNIIEKHFHPNKAVLAARKKTLITDFLLGYQAAKKQGDTKNKRKIFFKLLRLSPSTVLKKPLKNFLYKKKENVLFRWVNFYYRYFPAKSGIAKTPNKIPIIVSLTSYPKRFSTLHICLKSLLNQGLKPDRIILYLTSDIQLNQIPVKILDLQKKGLEIKCICEDLKPHKKYFYAMQEFRDAAIITVDDDVIYPCDTIKSLMENFKKHPECISARRVHLISYDINHHALPYNLWKFEFSSIKKPSFELLATGVGGVLYPPHIFDPNKSYFNIQNIQQNALNADDIWLKFCEMEENIPVSAVPCKRRHPYKIDAPALAETGLENDNRLKNRNDEIIQSCEKFFSRKL